uniref:Uncharacterized protein n=1 Tax=Arundo donax TaxID=35708 RepID=A0A0A9BAL3_ARUDO
MTPRPPPPPSGRPVLTFPSGVHPPSRHCFKHRCCLLQNHTAPISSSSPARARCPRCRSWR